MSKNLSQFSRMDSPEKPSRSRDTSRNNEDVDPFEDTPPAPTFKTKLRAVPGKKVTPPQPPPFGQHLLKNKDGLRRKLVPDKS